MPSSRGEPPIDFPALAAALLARADTLVPQWLPAGTKRGHHWYVGDFRGSKGKSANVNLETGTWIDNGAPEDKGGDLISLYACIRGMSQAGAARELVRDNGWTASTVIPDAKPKKPKGMEWMPLHPVPADAPPYNTQWAHYARGIPTSHWEYRGAAGELLGVVCRFDKSDGTKDVQPLSFCQGADGRRLWRYKAFNQPRPLYGLDCLARFVDAPDGLVIVVEGEKKRDALWHALEEKIPVVSWPGGCKTAHLADWRPIAGRRVVCWPDADAQRRDKTSEALLELEKQPGMMAMRKVQSIAADLGCQVRIVDVGQPGEKPDGWDAADAIAAGWTREQLLELLKRHVPVLRAVEAVGATAKPSAPEPNNFVQAAPEADRHWRDRLLLSKGSVRECVPNVALVLANHPAWRGVLAYDEFAQRVVKRRRAPFELASAALVSDEWSDVDDTLASMWFADIERISPSAGQVLESVEVVARMNRFHPVRDYLKSLDPWDGRARIDHWLVDFLGVADTPYVRKVSRYYLIGMVMRVLQPGVKFDYCLVFEGKQGRLKSTALSILAGAWFSDNELDLSNRDSKAHLRGKWLHEFQEMGALARQESSRQKSFLSLRVDEYRPAYGRREIKCPRQVVFSGSVNHWQWNADPTGGRRFWPARVPEFDIDIEGLRRARDALFAEAYKLALSGERYWPNREEQDTLFDPEQLSREQPEPFVELIAEWLDAPATALLDTFTMADVLQRALKLDAKGMTKDITTRVGSALSKLGIERVEHRTKIPRFVYRRPKEAASSQPGQSAASAAGELPI